MTNHTPLNQLSLFDVERWLPVVGYEDVYAVSNHGRVMRLAGSERVKENRIVKQGDNGRGYMFVRLWADNKPQHRYVHRLVMQSFVGECPEGITVNHIDGNKANNHLSNLEYATHSENIQHAYNQGLNYGARGEMHSMAKLTQTQADEIRRLYALGGISQRSLAAQFRISPSVIGGIIHGKRW
jgi:hypothetical protein